MMNEQNGVVIAEKNFHKGSLFGAIGYGGSMLEVSHGKYLKITKLNDNFVNIQIVDSGIGSKLRTQTYTKPKVIEKKVIIEKEVKPKQKKLEFDVGEKDEVLF